MEAPPGPQWLWEVGWSRGGQAGATPEAGLEGPDCWEDSSFSEPEIRPRMTGDSLNFLYKVLIPLLLLLKILGCLTRGSQNERVKRSH